MEKAAGEARDPAEQVFPIGRPGETQEVRSLLPAVVLQREPCQINTSRIIDKGV